LDVAGENVQWSFNSRLEVSLTTNYIDLDNNRWQGKFDFRAADVQDTDALILETLITLMFSYKESQEVIQISDRIGNLLIALAAHRYIKIVYQSIHMNAPSVSEGLPDTVDFEFKINGIWEQVVIRLETINFADKTMRSNRYALAFNGSNADWKMLLSTGMGQSLADAVGDFKQVLGWSTPEGENWIFDPSSSMQNQVPYDLKPDAEPVDLTIDLGAKYGFNGFRIDGGRLNPGRQLPNGFPDSFHFLVSDDRRTWTRIPGSETEITNRSLLEWEWD